MIMKKSIQLINRIQKKTIKMQMKSNKDNIHMKILI
jgi:hypothetical protein